MSTPELHLRTSFVLDQRGRIVSTREPAAQRGPLFTIARGATRCAWAIRSDVPDGLAHELARLAREEPPAPNLREPPVHALRYQSLLGDRLRGAPPSGGPAFTFPETLPRAGEVVVVEDEGRLERHFRGWIPGEIGAGRAPVLAVVAEGVPVSICFCARSSEIAAEAGLETATPFRGRGLGPRVAAAWAEAIRASGRLPLYSTAWSNDASLAVARKLRLEAYASSWSLAD